MSRPEPLNAMQALEATAVLNELFNNTPEMFLAAFQVAVATPALNFSGETTTVALQWVEGHATGLADNHTAAKIVANAVLSNADILKQIKKTSAKVWFFLCEALFPHFDLVRGWLAIAQKGGLRPGHIRVFIMTRVRAIDSLGAGGAEEQFLMMLLSHPSNPGLGYRTLLTSGDLQEIVEIVGRFAPHVLRSTQTDTMGWRHQLP